MELLGPPVLLPAGNCMTKEVAMDTLISQVDNLNVQPTPMGLTENFSPTFLSTGNPCLDFFFHVVPDTPPSELIQRLQLAWIRDPLVSLKLIFNLRGVRGTGKSDKEGFYAAALWLHEHHPKTLALNVRALADFGYLKDLAEILYRLHEGLDSRKNAKDEWKIRKRGKEGSRRNMARKFKREGKKRPEVSKEERKTIIDSVEKVGNVLNKETARKLRKEKELNKLKRALERYRNDPKYRFLHDCICSLFAELLKSDVENLKSGKGNKISLAAKWCPSIDSSYDKVTLIFEGIARRVFPRDSDPEYKQLEEAHYAYRVRDRLRKRVLVPLHKALELPEVAMSAKKWESLSYNRVPSVAMKNYKEIFLKHDKERFDDYLEKVKSGKAKIAAGALLPHEILMSLNDEDDGKVAELQWARMLEDIKAKGMLGDCIAVCDVSTSMAGTPMEVSVALGLLVSQLSAEPWKDKVITFSDNPELHVIEGDTLRAKAEFVRCMDWGGSTDFQKVFDRILEVALADNITNDLMMKKIFVFSDMEFNEASGLVYENYCDMNNNDTNCSDSEEEMDVEKRKKREEEALMGKKEAIVKALGPVEKWETDYEVTERKYRERGFKVPEIVFWNLRNSHATPVLGKQKGVALVSGFSKNLLTLFLNEGGIVNPEDVMVSATAGEEYKKLVVYD